MPKVVSIQGIYNPKQNIKYEPKIFLQSKEQKLSTIFQRNSQNVQQYFSINNEMTTDHRSLLTPIQSQQNVSSLYSNPSLALVQSSFNMPQLMNQGNISQHQEKDGQQMSTGDRIFNRFDQTF